MTTRSAEARLQSEEAAPPLMKVRATLERCLAESGGAETVKALLGQEMRDLLDFIQKAKRDIDAIEPEKIRHQHIPGATTELEAVVGTTEEATGHILDAAEAIETLASETGGEVGERLRTIATGIYEASNFQDLTGQRIAKVVSILLHIEAKIGELAGAFGHDAAAIGPVRVEADGTELHGPQASDSANHQDDIDRLMAEMGSSGEVSGQDAIDKLFD
jgi:chemotaxis protein CheZ